jgi:hypothetical protein
MFCFDCHDIAEKIVYLVVNNNHSLILDFVNRKKTRMINKSKNNKKTPFYSKTQKHMRGATHGAE